MTVWSNRILILLGAVGIFVAGVLSYATWQRLALPCGVNMGCAMVQSSQYSKIGGFPVSYIGLLGYVGLFSVAVVRSMVTGAVHRRLAIAGFAMAGLGMLFSLYLTYVSFAVIGAKCPWCLASLGVIVVTFIAHAALLQGGEAGRTDSTVGVFGGAAAILLSLGAIAIRSHGLQAEFAIESVVADPAGFTVEQVLPIDAKIRGGGTSAKVTIIEFADMNCPVCRSVYPDIARIVNKYGGKVRLAYRHFPLIGEPGHETSLDAAVIGEIAADRGLFWKYLDGIMKPSNTERVRSLDGIMAIAGEVGVSRGEIMMLFNSQDPEVKKKADSYYNRVNDDINLGAKLKVLGTPTFFVFADGVKPKSVAEPRLEILLSESPYRELLQ